MTTTQTAIRHIPIEGLQLSTTGSQAERRRHFDKVAIADLADSIRTVGLLQPIVARAVNGHFEIVAGERRFLAAREAGLDEIPVNVRELTDEQVLEVQLIENLQREGLHELAEAEGYEALMKLGHTAEEIADKVGKSKAYVYARLKLTALHKDARTAFYDGKLTSSTALLLARIPVEKLQLQALKDLTKVDYDGERMSFRAAAKHVREQYMTDLSGGGFPTTDASLVAAAGACGPCPKRTGNQAQLFDDVKSGNVCTDPACFQSKIAAYAQRRLAEAEAKGQKIISGKEAKKIAPYGAERSSLQGFVRLNDHDYGSTKSTTYRQLLGKDFVPTLLQDPESGKVIEVASEAAVKQARPNGTLARSGGSDWNAQQLAKDKKRRAEAAARNRIFKAAHDAALKVRKALSREDLEWLANCAFDGFDSDSQKRLFDALGWEGTKRKSYGGFDYKIEAKVAAMSETELQAFLRVLPAARDLQVPGWSDEPPKRLNVAAARLNVDTKKIRAELAAAAKTKAPKKGKAKR
jgi:ParB/RepB/Spo0J family partition protein